MEEGNLKIYDQENSQFLKRKKSTNCMEGYSFILVSDSEKFLNDQNEFKKLDELLLTNFPLLKLIAMECKNNCDIEMGQTLLEYCDYNNLTLPFFKYLFTSRIEMTSNL